MDTKFIRVCPANIQVESFSKCLWTMEWPRICPLCGQATLAKHSRPIEMQRSASWAAMSPIHHINICIVNDDDAS